MTWLVTGGAGYIGSHVVQAFLDAGMTAVVLDDLSSGRREFVPEGVPLVVGSITDVDVVAGVFRDHDVEGVVHVAGYKYAGVSVREPLICYHVNVEGTRVLVEQCLAADVRAVVFSSSAAVFGTPDVDLVTEDTPKAPESPYGESKLIGEWLLRDTARVFEQLGQPAFRHTSLRYFNVVGSGIPTVYDVSPHNLFPIVLATVTDGRRPVVFGDDYATPDGTCLRDYIHVTDLADAHVKALEAIMETGTSRIYNLGTGHPHSVRDVIEAVERVTGLPVPWTLAPRRPGDPAVLYAAANKAKSELRWTPRFADLDSIVRTAWNWHQGRAQRAGAGHRA